MRGRAWLDSRATGASVAIAHQDPSGGLVLPDVLLPRCVEGGRPSPADRWLCIVEADAHELLIGFQRRPDSVVRISSVQYQIPKDGPVHLSVFDVQGQFVWFPCFASQRRGP